MKKFKEFLLLFVPLIVLTILPIILFVTNQTENSFIGNPLLKYAEQLAVNIKTLCKSFDDFSLSPYPTYYWDG